MAENGLKFYLFLTACEDVASLNVPALKIFRDALVRSQTRNPNPREGIAFVEPLILEFLDKCIQKKVMMS